jgi:hypothetical protein
MELQLKITEKTSITIDSTVKSDLLEVIKLYKSHQIKKLALTFARKKGYNSVTSIVISTDNKILEHTKFGYRKYTTGEYVSNAYRDKFGWKNTYYQPAVTHLMIDYKDLIA